jgi:transcriptional regulator with XRE-family HTH domain
MEQPEVQISNRLKKMRKELGITQRQLAYCLSVAHNTISQYEKGVINPSLSFVVKLAKLFEVSTDYLLGVTEDYA